MSKIIYIGVLLICALSCKPLTEPEFSNVHDPDAPNFVPDKPTLVNATLSTDKNFVTITWADNSNYESGYTIQKKIGAGNWETLLNVDTDSESYTDSLTTAGTVPIKYRVASTYRSTQSPYTESNLVTFTFRLTVTIDGQGAVKENVVQGKSEYDYGTFIELLPSPTDGWRFHEWNGDIDGAQESIVVQLTEDMNIKAVFKPREFADLQTLEITDIGRINAVSGGRFLNTYGSSILEKGLCWSESSSPTFGVSDCSSDGSGFSAYTSDITGLSPATTYFARAYARNRNGVFYGETFQFTTLPPPSWTEIDVTNGLEILDIHLNGTQWYVVAENGIYKSSDNGLNWTQIVNSTELTYTSITSDNNGTIYAGAKGGVAAVQNFAYIFKSTNGGSTWGEVLKANHLNESVSVSRIIAQSDGNVVALINQRPNVSQTYGHMYYSTDGGKYWEHISEQNISGTSSNNGGMFDATLIGDKLLIGGGKHWNFSAYRTTTFETSFFANGSTQIDASHFSAGLFSFAAIGSSNSIAVGVSPDGRWAISENRGQDWSVGNIIDYEIIELHDIVVVDDQTFYATGSNGTVLQTDNAGEEWLPVSGLSSFNELQSADVTNLIYLDDDHLILTASNGKIYLYR